MKNLVEVIAKSLVDNPDEVVVTEKIDGNKITLSLTVADGDMGQVIGKQGRVVNSIRSVIKAVAIKENKFVNIEVV